MKRLVKNIIKWAPIAYPIVKKMWGKRKARQLKASS
ncbi:hypothetical protein LH637_010615 [Bacillus infantis]|jgi:hypothetical protein|nr:hypothetical protein [Bacillus infantis]MCR6610739.1 hypothetical protein [Bacillus infantis]